MMIYENALNIFTDGSSRQSPRVGGVGVRFVKIDSMGDEEIQEVLFSGYKEATNNQMELYACILALNEADRLKLTSGTSRIVIFTDSLYVADNYKKAMFEWSKNKWLSRYGRPILNAELWKQLVKCISRTKLNFEIIWVKGHAKNIHNKAADKLAKQSAKIPANKPLSVVFVRKKLTSDSCDPGCVKLSGQRISIRIITSEYLNTQRVSKYKYEVISKSNKYYGCVDIIFSTESLRAGHSYFVKVNDDEKNPRILKILHEIK